MDLRTTWLDGAGNGWKMAVAAVSGLIAKENVVATFGQLFGFAEVAEDGSEIWKSLSLVMTPVAAYGFWYSTCYVHHVSQLWVRSSVR